MNKKYLELTKLIRSKQNDHEILKCLSNYHENDIADMLTVMTPKERKRIYTLLGPQKIAEIFAYLDEPQIYFSELSVKDAAKVVSLMDSDDAVDVLETLDDKKKYEIVENLDKAAIKDVKMLLSYDDDEIGSCMTTNYICIPKGLSVRQAMSELVRQAVTYASDLCRYIASQGDFDIAGACYPEVHSEATDEVEDIHNLRKKVESGASHLISQLFFDNSVYYRFLERAKIAGVNVPIEAGIMQYVTERSNETKT